MNFPLTRDEDVTRRGMIIKSPSQSWQPEGPSSTKTKDVMLGVCACDCLKDHQHHWWTATALTGLRSAPWHFRAGFSSKQSKLPLLQGVSQFGFPWRGCAIRLGSARGVVALSTCRAAGAGHADGQSSSQLLVRLLLLFLW